MSRTPHDIDLLIEAGWVIPVDRPGAFAQHAIAIREGRIVDLVPISEARQRYTPRERVTLEHHAVIPGLVNLHTHAAMSLMRGLADDLPLMTWLQQHIWPAEAAHVSDAFVLDGSRLACAEMLLGGITCFNDMYFFPEATARAAAEFGQRAVLGITTLEFPTAYASDAEDYLHQGLAIRERWLHQPRLSFCLAPHAPYTVSDPTFEKIAVWAEQLNLPIHCHIHETRQEIEDSLRQHGQRPLARLQRLGLLGPQFIGVHAVHLEPDEIALLAEAGCSLAHCPSSNLKLASGFAPIHALQQAGVRLGLGTDGAASNNRLDLFEEMRLASLLAKGVSGDASALPAQQALHMATLGGAQALGLGDQIGSITPGKAADLCAVDFGLLSNRPCYDPVAHLVYVTGRESVTHVWVEGECCINERRFVRPLGDRLEAAIAVWQNKLHVHPSAFQGTSTADEPQQHHP